MCFEIETEYENLLNQIVNILAKKEISEVDKLQTICKLLRNNINHYDWVGFYYLDEQHPGILKLGPYEGKPTQHTRIEIGRGICGQAASTKETYVVQDVSKETNYLSCSPKVKAEIVLPVFEGEVLIGELDIDSHMASPFSLDDRVFLEKISKLVGPLLNKYRKKAS